MKNVTVKINLYSYNELSGIAKKKAFIQHYQFLRDFPEKYEDENGEMKFVDISEWDVNEILEYVEESIMINDYLFYENGELANTLTYINENGRKDKTELWIGGKVVSILEEGKNEEE